MKPTANCVTLERTLGGIKAFQGLHPPLPRGSTCI